MAQKILVINAAALGFDLAVKHLDRGRLCGLKLGRLETVFPAVTCTVQASFRTGMLPSGHGIVGNGFFSRETARTFFWEQSSSLVQGSRIWDNFRRKGRTVGQLFWQQSLGTDSDVLLSPAPIHKHHGGMIQDCFSMPSGLYPRLVADLGRGFDLADYWGPRASAGSTAWIAAATVKVMESPSPDLLLTYLPHMDYELQKSGPDSAGAAAAFAEMVRCLETLAGAAKGFGYRVLVFGDYAIAPVSKAAFPNRVLLREGLLSCRDVKGRIYPDLHTSRAFAVADHQTAHVIVRDSADIDRVAEVLKEDDGIADVMDAGEMKDRGLHHARSGDLLAVARPGAWLAYPWWTHDSERPDYAAHVDIHNKPGYDPCELFRGFWPFSISTDTSRIKGSHGLVGSGLQTAWASDIDMDSTPGSLTELSAALARVIARD